MKDQEVEKIKGSKEKKPLRTKIILYVLGSVILLVIGMVLGIRFSFAMQASALYLQKMFTWLVFILILLAIIAIPIAWKVYKHQKRKED